MTRYRMSDGMVVDTDLASRTWLETTRFDGRNEISVIAGTQWDHQTLCRSKRGRYYVISWSDWQGSVASAEWVDSREAARWLMLCGHELPEELQALADELTD